MLSTSVHRLMAVLCAASVLLVLALPNAHADTPPQERVQKEAARILSPHNPYHKLERPPLTGFGTLRFLADVRNVPLSFLDHQGQPTGFAVELARALCLELGLTCTVQLRSSDALEAGMSQRQGDVLMLAQAITASERARFEASTPYFLAPVRFVAQKTVIPSSQKRRVGVVRASPAALFLADLFPDVQLENFENRAQLYAALLANTLPEALDEALPLAFWLHKQGGDACCQFVGAAYLDAPRLGDGYGFLVRKGDMRLRRALDYGVQQLFEKGLYEELYLRWFPIGVY